MSIIKIATRKRGMSQILINGKVVPVSLLEYSDHDVFRIKTKKVDGYNAICFSFGEEVKKKHISKPMLTQFEKKSLTPRKNIFEVRVESDSSEIKLEGEKLDFEVIHNLLLNATIDVSGVSVGKGFAGVMKRWNFRGLEATHGVSITHRSHGSTGQRQDPGKVFLGKKMAGHYGVDNTTVQNLEVVMIDKELKLIAVKGAVPGHDNGIVYIHNAVKLQNVGSAENVNGLKVIYS